VDALTAEVHSRPGQRATEPVSFATARACIRAAMKKTWREATDPAELGVPEEHMWREITAQGFEGAVPAKSDMGRKHQRELARLRSGYSPLLAKDLSVWSKEGGPECQFCGHEREDTVHLFACPATACHRQDIFGSTDPGLQVLVKQQPKVILYLQRIGKLARPRGRGE
jgi:hypothetical protein